MRLSVVPQERRFYTLFKRQGELVSESLAQLRNGLLEGKTRHPRLRELEHECDDVTHEIYNLINHTFVTPLEREDIYTLASQLDDVTDAIEAAADMLVLHKVTEPIEAIIEQSRLLCRASVLTAEGLRHLRRVDEQPLRDYWVAVNELENEGDRLYRRARADLYAFTGEHPARYVLTWKDIVDQLEEALDGLEDVAHTVESIVLKHA
jgi:predicted phosphate transport protein (TIGR00153 family)